MTDHTELPGLSGDNPQKFLAALGVMVALEAAGKTVRMSWKEDASLCPVITPSITLEEIAEAVLELADKWQENSRLFAEKLSNKEQNLSIPITEVRDFVEHARVKGNEDRFLYSCISEGALPEGDKTVSKPTALCFTSGTEYFAKHAKEILSKTTTDHITNGLANRYAYIDKKREKEGKVDEGKKVAGVTMRWDFSDSAQYALSSNNPAKVQKPTNPGVEAMAILGLSCVPCFTVNSKTRTQGVKQTNRKSEYKGAEFWWPLWKHPAALSSIRTFLAHAQSNGLKYFTDCGITRIFSSEIRDLPQGRKSFRFPTVMLNSKYITS